jgi:hypothetical protein
MGYNPYILKRGDYMDAIIWLWVVICLEVGVVCAVAAIYFLVRVRQGKQKGILEEELCSLKDAELCMFLLALSGFLFVFPIAVVGGGLIWLFMHWVCPHPLKDPQPFD